MADKCTVALFFGQIMQLNFICPTNREIESKGYYYYMTMAFFASTIFQPQITSILWRNCWLRGVFQNKTQYFRLRWYDSDFECSLIALWVLDSFLIALRVFSDLSEPKRNFEYYLNIVLHFLSFFEICFERFVTLHFLRISLMYS